MDKIVILDYTLGNLFNVQRAFDFINCRTTISSDPEEVYSADKIILPGVGAFGEGIKQLKSKGLDIAVKEAAKKGKPILGICLGMQLLLSESEEHGNHEGLDLIPGKVLRFDSHSEGDNFKIPQIGWNRISTPVNTSWDGTILGTLPNECCMYFVHSYYVKVDNPENSLANTTYGYNEFCSVVKNDNVLGCQFHPERSGKDGLKILENFLKQ